MVRGQVRARVISQEAPGAEPTVVQLSPRRVELRSQGRVPFSISLWLPKPHNSMSHWLRRPKESSWAAPSSPGKQHGEFPGSMPSHPAPLLAPRLMVLAAFVIGFQEREP